MAAKEILVRKLVAGLSLVTNDFDRKWSDVEKKLYRSAKALKRTGETLTRSITVPLAGIGALAVRETIKFESAFAGVRKTVEATEKQFKELEGGIVQMSKQLPASASQIARVAEAAGQLGIERENILSFSRTMIDLGESTNLSATQAATALARFSNIVQLPQDKISNLGSSVVELGNNLATTEAEIVEMGLRLAGAGAQAGLTAGETLGLSGALSSVGVYAEAGGSAFSRVLVKMGDAVKDGSDKLKVFAQVSGTTADQFAAQFRTGPAEALRQFIEGLGEIQRSGESTTEILSQLGYSELRTADALRRLAGAGELLGKSFKLGEDGFRENVALTEEAEKRYATLESQLKRVYNVFSAFLRDVGERLTPFIRALGSGIEALSGVWDSLNPRVQDFVIAAAGLLAIAGPVAYAIGSLGTILVAIQAPFVVLTAKVAGLGAILYAAKDDIVSVYEAMVVGTKTALRVVYNAFKDHFDGLDILFEHYKQKLTEIIRATENFAVATGRTLLSALDWVVGGFEFGFQRLNDFTGIFDSVADAYVEVQVESKGAAQAVSDYFGWTKKAGEETDKTGKSIKGAKGELKEFLDALNGLKGGASGAAGLGSKIGDSLGKADLGKFKVNVQDSLEEAHTNAVETWRNTFQDAITGVRFDLENALQQVAVGFAAEIAASIFGGVSAGIKGPADIGGAIAQSFGIGGTSGSGGGFLGSIGSIFGSSNSPFSLGGAFDLSSFGATARPDGVAGPLLPDGNFTPGPGNAAVNAAGFAVAAANAADALDKFGNSTEETAESLTTLGGTAIGAFFGPAGAGIGSSIGRFLGGYVGDLFGGPKDPGTVARIEAGNKINEFLDSIGGLNYFQNGQGRRVDSIDPRLFDDFSNFDANRDLFDKFGDDASQAFLGAGRGLGEILGIDNLEGDHLGVILADAFEGGTQALKAFLNAFGIGAEQIEEQLLKIAKAGDITWHEFETQLQAVNKALEPGIEGLGKYEEALSNFLNSGGRGQVPLDQLRNLAVEAKEVGLDLGQLEQSLRDSGQYADETITAVFTAIRGRGIDSVEQLAEASDRTLGGVTADAQSLGVVFEDAFQSVQQAADALNSIPDYTEKEVHFNVTASVSPEAQAALEGTDTGTTVNALGNIYGPLGVQAFAKGGIVHRPTLFRHGGGLGLMGEAGPEGILPLKRMSGGRLGVSAEGMSGGRAVVINIDARGAGPGVAAQIRREIQAMGQSAINQSVDIVMDHFERGGA